MAPERATLEKLFELGQASAQRWLKRSFDAVGRKSSVNLKRDYGDPLKLQFEPLTSAAGEGEETDEGDGVAAEPGLDWSRFRWSADEQQRAAEAADAAARSAAEAARGPV